MSNSAFKKMGGVMDADTEDMPLEKDMTGKRKGSMANMGHEGSAMPMYGKKKK